MDNRMPPINNQEAAAYAKVMGCHPGDVEFLEEDGEYDLDVFKRVYHDTGNGALALQCASKNTYVINGAADASAGSMYPTDEELEEFDNHTSEHMHRGCMSHPDIIDEYTKDPEPLFFRRTTKKPSYQFLTAMRMKIEKLTSSRGV